MTTYENLSFLRLYSLLMKIGKVRDSSPGADCAVKEGGAAVRENRGKCLRRRVSLELHVHGGQLYAREHS